MTIKKLNDEKILKICKSKIYAPPTLEIRKCEKQNFFIVEFFFPLER